MFYHGYPCCPSPPARAGFSQPAVPNPLPRQLVFSTTPGLVSSKRHLLVDSPQGSFTNCVDWVLMQCGSPFTVCPTSEDLASPTSDPRAKPAVSHVRLEMEPERSPEAVFILDPEPNTESVQVCDLATASITEGILVEFNGINKNPTHTHKVRKPSWSSIKVILVELNKSGFMCRIRCSLIFSYCWSHPVPSHLSQWFSTLVLATPPPNTAHFAYLLLKHPFHFLEGGGARTRVENHWYKSLLVKPSTKSSMVKPSSKSALVKPNSKSLLVKHRSKLSSSSNTKSSLCMVLSSLPLPPPLSKPSSSLASSPHLFSFIPLASPVVPLSCMDLLGAFQSSAPPWHLDPSAPLQASKSWTPPWPSNPSAPDSTLPQLHHGLPSLRVCQAPSSLWLHLGPSSLWLHSFRESGSGGKGNYVTVVVCLLSCLVSRLSFHCLYLSVFESLVVMVSNKFSPSFQKGAYIRSMFVSLCSGFVFLVSFYGF